MNENEVVIEQPEENAAQEKPEMPQDGHRRPGPCMPPPPKDGQKGFRQPPEDEENGSRRPPEGFGKGPGKPPFGRPGEKPTDAPEETPAEESVEE